MKRTILVVVLSVFMALNGFSEAFSAPLVEDAVGKFLGTYFLGEEVPIVMWAKAASNTVRATVLKSDGTLMEYKLLASMTGYGNIKHNDLELTRGGTYETNTHYYILVRNETTGIEDIGYFDTREGDAGFGQSSSAIPERFSINDTVTVGVHGSVSCTFTVTNLAGTLVTSKAGTVIADSCIAEFTGLEPGDYVITASTTTDEHAPCLVRIEQLERHRSSLGDVKRVERILDIKKRNSGGDLR